MMLDKRFIKVILELVTTGQYSDKGQRKTRINTMAMNEVLRVAFVKQKHPLKVNGMMS